MISYLFARARWNAVWCCNRIKPGCITDLASKPPSVVATALAVLSTGSATQQAVVQEFRSIITEHERLILSAPGTATDGAQDLFDQLGQVWDLKDLGAFCERIAKNCIDLDGPIFPRPSLEADLP